VGEVSPQSRRLAMHLQQELVTGLPREYRPVTDLGVKKGPFYVLFLSSMPSVLVESGFVTHAARGEAAARRPLRGRARGADRRGPVRLSRRAARDHGEDAVTLPDVQSCCARGSARTRSRSRRARYLAEARESCASAHAAGASGRDLNKAHSDLIDGWCGACSSSRRRTTSTRAARVRASSAWWRSAAMRAAR
jgi:hypothetical protein